VIPFCDSSCCTSMFRHYEDTESNNIFSFGLNNANFDPEDKESEENFPQLLQADKCLTRMDEVECRARKKISFLLLFQYRGRALTPACQKTKH